MMNTTKFFSVDDFKPLEALPFPLFIQYELGNGDSIVIESMAKNFMLSWLRVDPASQPKLANRLLGLVPNRGDRFTITQMDIDDEDEDAQPFVNLTNVSPLGTEKHRIVVLPTR